MNIAVNARLLHDGPLEGIPRFIWENLQCMIRNHPDDHFFLYFDKKPHDKYSSYDNVTAIHIPLPTRLPILWNIWFDYLLPFYFKKNKIDVFFSGEGYLSLRTKIPTLMVIHDLAYIHYPEYQKDIHVRYFQKRMPKFLRKAESIVAVSDFTKQDILKQFPTIKKEIKIAYNALPSIAKMDSPKKYLTEPYFLYLGAIHPRKNILNLVKGFELFKKNNPDSKIQLILAGRKAWMNDKLDQYVENSFVKKEILFTGMVSEEVKHQLFHFAEAFVYISQFEGFGIPVLEAFHHRIPVITSKGSSMEEISDGAAILVQPTQIDEIALALQKVADGSFNRQEYIQRGTQRIQYFDWGKSAATLYQSLRKIARQ